MTLRPKTLREKKKLVQQAALKYCETADSRLKLALLQADQRLSHAKSEFLRHEGVTSQHSNKHSLNRLSTIMDIAKNIVDAKSDSVEALDPPEVDDLYAYYVPYIQAMRLVELREKEFDIIKKRIELNAEIYHVYKEELDKE
ncbi:hypothetical protein BgAZ_108530 [Babesia gibsoni]|uniref:Uncharacterized protein n=1 Tax=Babesia gibsoni TaxID=33632 RepID=A0AAD8PGP5_BABGI|nr:hypothetical protein BgAZ_108530 [Babesia gibsoni]